MRHAMLALLLALLAPAGVLAQTVPISATVAPGNVPTITWSVPWASSCMASGGWSGSKAPGGSQAVAAVTATTSYTLTCTAPGDTIAQINWTLPTVNTDGTALTDLAGYKLYRGTAASNLSLATTINSPSTLTYTFTGMTGTNYFAVSAITTAGVESALSNVAMKTQLGGQSGSGSVTVTVPKPPVLTIAAIPGAALTPAYKYTLAATGKATRSETLAGLVAVGKSALGARLFAYRGKHYCQIAQADVLWESNGVAPGPLVAAACGG